MKKHPKGTIYLSNLSEDVWEFVQSLSPQIGAKEIRENMWLSDRDVFAFSKVDHTLFVMPQTLDPNFWQYFFNLFGLKNCQVISPRKHTGELCRDIQMDNKIVSFIRHWAKNYQMLDFIPYSTTNQFYNLLETLKLPKASVMHSESFSLEHLPKISKMGSKSGIRNFDLPLVAGKVFTKLSAAIEHSSQQWWKNGSVVIKTNKAHAGMGVLILREKEKPHNLAACKQAITQYLSQNNYWKRFPIIVEKFVSTNAAIGGGFPNAEFCITPKGKIKYLYACGMRVTPEGEYKGLEIGVNCLNPSIISQLRSYGNIWGKQLAQNGYRGYYDIDCLLGMDGKLYFSESNVRRTGGTHVFHTAIVLFGPNYLKKTYILSQNMYNLPKKTKLTFTQLVDILGSLAFNTLTKEGVIITSANLLENFQFGYIIFGNDKKSALKIENTMEYKLRKI